MKIAHKLFLVFLFFTAVALVMSQEHEEQDGSIPRGSIPEELLRPKRGEAPFFPIDTVIGGLGQGGASDEAYSFARSIARGFLSGNAEHHALTAVNAVLRESYLSLLDVIQPLSFRIGSGREEPDGAISFLIRFIGREQSITGELFVRFITRQARVSDDESQNFAPAEGNWVFDELILELPRSRTQEQRDALHRFDFSPYERFF
jgi:hypothetical protein